MRIGDEDHPLVPAGLMLGVRMMAEGQSCIVRCASKYGYGSIGWNGVPPNSALEYHVRMLECSPANAPFSDLAAAIERKELGNLWFRAGRYPRASRCYQSGTQIVGDVSTASVEQAKNSDGGDHKEASALLEVAVALGNNHCRAEEKLGNMTCAKAALVGVLIRDPANLKALLAAVRLGVVTHELIEAEAALSKCKELVNAGHSMHADLLKAEKLLKEAKRKEKLREKELFGGKLGKASKVKACGSVAETMDAVAKQRLDDAQM